MLQRNIWPPSSGSKSDPSKNPKEGGKNQSSASFLPGLLSSPKDGDGRLFRNVRFFHATKYYNTGNNILSV
jgi:hypothetical protein